MFEGSDKGFSLLIYPTDLSFLYLFLVSQGIFSLVFFFQFPRSPMYFCAEREDRQGIIMAVGETSSSRAITAWKFPKGGFVWIHLKPNSSLFSNISSV